MAGSVVGRIASIIPMGTVKEELEFQQNGDWNCGRRKNDMGRQAQLAQKNINPRAKSDTHPSKNSFNLLHATV